MIIDVSNTIGKHKFKEEITAESLLEQMDNSGVDKAVIHCYAECIDNDSVYRAKQQYPDRFIGLFTVNPWEDSSADQLENALTNKGFRGLYMDPIRHGYMLCEHKVFYPLLEVVRKHQGVVWCYGAAEVFSNPVFFDQIAADFPDVPIIMGRMGLQYDNASAVAVAKKHKNMYLETSSSMDFNTLRAIKVVGIDNVLLGTGTPDSGYFNLEIAKVKNAAKGFEGGEEAILYRNAARIFHISEEV